LRRATSRVLIGGACRIQNVMSLNAARCAPLAARRRRCTAHAQNGHASEIVENGSSSTAIALKMRVACAGHGRRARRWRAGMVKRAHESDRVCGRHTGRGTPCARLRVRQPASSRAPRHDARACMFMCPVRCGVYGRGVRERRAWRAARGGVQNRSSSGVRCAPQPACYEWQRPEFGEPASERPTSCRVVRRGVGRAFRKAACASLGKNRWHQTTWCHAEG